jgi:hypothetical protein
VSSCTSNSVSWTATLYREPAWQKSVIKPGNYSGPAGQGWNMTFSVASGGKSMGTISIPTVSLSCTQSQVSAPGVTIPQVAVQPNGSFSTKVSQSGVVDGSNARVTYTFAGYFEGPTPSGASTVSGTWREDVVFTSGTAQTCTSDNVSWTTTLS